MGCQPSTTNRGAGDVASRTGEATPPIEARGVIFEVEHCSLPEGEESEGKGEGGQGVSLALHGATESEFFRSVRAGSADRGTCEGADGSGTTSEQKVGAGAGAPTSPAAAPPRTNLNLLSSSLSSGSGSKEGSFSPPPLPNFHKLLDAAERHKSQGSLSDPLDSLMGRSRLPARFTGSGRTGGGSGGSSGSSAVPGSGSISGSGRVGLATLPSSIFDYGSLKGSVLSIMNDEVGPATGDATTGSGSPQAEPGLPPVPTHSFPFGDVSVDDLLQLCGQELPGGQIMAGSTSTARLSVRSERSSSHFGSTRRSGGPQAAGEAASTQEATSATVRRPQYAFNSLSAFAPHSAQDRIEIKKRLKGGYTDPTIEAGVYYPTPQERRLAREHELQHEARSRQVLCPGKGLLWSHPSVQEGLPCPLEVLERSYEREPLFVNNPPWYADVRCRGRILQFFFAIQQFLPSLIRELTDEELLSTNAVDTALDMVEDFVSASHRDTCRHPRIRILLTQLLVLLTDTLILLEEPDRFMLEFSKVNELELMTAVEHVGLSQQATEGEVQQDLVAVFSALKRHQASLFTYVLLMIDNCISVAAVEADRSR